MEIKSAFNSGVQGFQDAQQQANEAALAIASETVYSADNPSQGQAVNDANEAENTSAGDLSDLNQEIVELKVAEYQAKASANVIETADEALGTLLDVTA